MDFKTIGIFETQTISPPGDAHGYYLDTKVFAPFRRSILKKVFFDYHIFDTVTFKLYPGIQAPDYANIYFTVSAQPVVWQMYDHPILYDYAPPWLSPAFIVTTPGEHNFELEFTDRAQANIAFNNRGANDITFYLSILFTFSIEY